GYRGIVGDVALVGNDRAGIAAGLLQRLLDRIEIAVDREHLGAFLGEAHCGGPAVAPAGADAAGAGDNRYFTRQPIAHSAFRQPSRCAVTRASSTATPSPGRSSAVANPALFSIGRLVTSAESPLLVSV